MASSKNRQNTKAPANASASSTTTEADVHSEHGTAGVSPAAVSPPGTSEPGGTNTRSEESGDAAGETSVELVKPQENAEPTPAIPVGAAPGENDPEAEASAFGINSTNTSEGGEAEEVGAGDPASPAAALVKSVFGRFGFTAEELASIDDGSETAEDIVGRELEALGYAMVRRVPGYTTLVSGTPFAHPSIATADLASTDEPAETLHGADIGQGNSRWVGWDDEFRRAYPLLSDAIATWRKTSDVSTPMLRVTSKEDGFRRGGVAHSKTPRDFNPGELMPDQIEAFLAEPMLTVEIV